jgi:hypothetical protein
MMMYLWFSLTTCLEGALNMLRYDVSYGIVTRFVWEVDVGPALVGNVIFNGAKPGLPYDEVHEDGICCLGGA